MPRWSTHRTLRCRDWGGGWRRRLPPGRLSRRRSDLEPQSPTHALSPFCVEAAPEPRPGAGWGRGGPALPPPGRAWGREQVTGGRSFTQCITNQLHWKNPSIYTRRDPALAQLGGWGHPGGRQLVWGLESGKGEVSLRTVSWPPCTPGSACASLAPLSQGGSRSPSPLMPCRDSIEQKICLSVCPADCLPRDPFSGSFLPLAIPSFWIK